MQTPLNISIPFPCHENWDAMTPETQGRHCKTCDKVVVDFTNMSDEEIIIYFQKTKENTCGRMTNHQLTEHPTLNKKLKLFLYALASVFLLSMNVEAQTDSIKNNNPINLGGDSSSGIYVVDGMIIKNETKTISGIVVDKNGTPLDFASVTLFLDSRAINGQKTNKKGEFNFKGIKKDKYTLRISYTGYEIIKKEIDLTKNEYSNQKIILFKNNPKNEGVLVKCYRKGLISKDGPIRKNDTIATQEYFIEGVVLDEKGEPIDFASVTIMQDDVVKGRKKTDLEGKFKIPLKTFGKSIISVSFVGLKTEELTIDIIPDIKFGLLYFNLKKEKNNKSDIFVGFIDYKIPIIDPQNPNRKIINKSDLKHMGY